MKQLQGGHWAFRNNGRIGHPFCPLTTRMRCLMGDLWEVWEEGFAKMVPEGDCEIWLIDFIADFSLVGLRQCSLSPLVCCVIRGTAALLLCRWASPLRRWGISTPQLHGRGVLVHSKAKGSLSDYQCRIQFISHLHRFNKGSRVELKPFLDFQDNYIPAHTKPKTGVIK